MNGNERGNGGFPISAGILFGLGLGGFFDGIVLHQILQWHHLVISAGYPPDSVENLKVNTLWDGVFHASTYVFTVLGLWILWRYSRENHIRWSGKLLPGTFLMGFGIFNLVEGIIDHQILGIHHVNETVPREQWGCVARIGRGIHFTRARLKSGNSDGLRTSKLEHAVQRVNGNADLGHTATISPRA
jgi:uncharacterized membrane protein